MGGMPWCYRNTQWNSTLSRLGCLCGSDRIGWHPDFAVPIFGCRWCHTPHWCNRQHWLHSHQVKESEECEQNFPSEFHGCASACSLKWEGWDLGLIIDLILLSMELSGNLNQYESGLAAGWSPIAVFQTFPLTSLTKTGCPGSNSMGLPWKCWAASQAILLKS